MGLKDIFKTDGATTTGTATPTADAVTTAISPLMSAGTSAGYVSPLIQSQQDYMQQIMASQLGTSTMMKANPATAPRYKKTTISLEESSNGTIIRVGEVVRICPTDGNLFDEVAAAYTESRL